MKLLVILLTVGMFSVSANAFTGGNKGCGKEYQCKEKKGEEKIACRQSRLTCQKGKLDKKIEKLKAVKGKKLEKRKAKNIEKMTKRISKNEERLVKAQAKLAELKAKAAGAPATGEKAADAKMTGEKSAKMQKRIKMKESHVQIVTERLKMLKDYKAQIEAIGL